MTGRREIQYGEPPVAGEPPEAMAGVPPPEGSGLPSGVPPVATASRRIAEVALAKTAARSTKFPEAFRDMRPAGCPRR